MPEIFLALPQGLNRIPAAGLRVPPWGPFLRRNWGKSEHFFRFQRALSWSCPFFPGGRQGRSENHTGAFLDPSQPSRALRAFQEHVLLAFLFCAGPAAIDQGCCHGFGHALSPGVLQ